MFSVDSKLKQEMDLLWLRTIHTNFALNKELDLIDKNFVNLIMMVTKLFYLVIL